MGKEVDGYDVQSFLQKISTAQINIISKIRKVGPLPEITIFTHIYKAKFILERVRMVKSAILYVQFVQCQTRSFDPIRANKAG